MVTPCKTNTFIPGGCTGYIQVLDVAINKSLKRLVKEVVELHYDTHLEEWKANKYSVGDRRVLHTHWVATAWQQLHEQYQGTIVQTFRNLGLALNPDGSEDIELQIKDLSDMSIGDYNRTDLDDAEEPEASAVVEAAAVAVVAAAEQASRSSTPDGSMNTRDFDYDLPVGALPQEEDDVTTASEDDPVDDFDVDSDDVEEESIGAGVIYE